MSFDPYNEQKLIIHYPAREQAPRDFRVAVKKGRSTPLRIKEMVCGSLQGSANVIRNNYGIDVNKFTMLCRPPNLDIYKKLGFSVVNEVNGFTNS